MPSRYFNPTEKWAAYVNDAGYGVGVYVPVCTGLTAYTVGTDPSQHRCAATGAMDSCA